MDSGSGSDELCVDSRSGYGGIIPDPIKILLGFCLDFASADSGWMLVGMDSEWILDGFRTISMWILAGFWVNSGSRNARWFLYGFW